MNARATPCFEIALRLCRNAQDTATCLCWADGCDASLEAHACKRASHLISRVHCHENQARESVRFMPISPVYSLFLLLPEQVEAALLPSTADAEGTAKSLPNEQLRALYAHNALGILSHMAAENDAAYFRGSRPSDSDEPPAVTREVISIELDAERGPLVEPPSSPRRSSPASPAPGAAAAVARGREDARTPAGRKSAATPNAPGAEKTFLRAPVPRRQHVQATHSEKSPPQQPQEGQGFRGGDRDHDCPPLHPSASRSPAAESTPAEGGGDSVDTGDGDEKGEGGGELGPEAEARAESTRFMWHLCRNAQRYGLTPQPTTSQKPVMSGTIFSREPALSPSSASSPSAIYGDDGSTVVGPGTEAIGESGDSGAEGPAAKPEKFPVCTFVLTTLDDHEKAPRDGVASSSRSDDDDDDGDDGKPAAAVLNRSFDVVLYVIEGARPMSCRSWNGEGSAITGVSGRDWWSDGPFPEDVALQASQLVERLLRLAIAQRRRDTVWELFDLDNPWTLFKNAMVVSSVTPPPRPSHAAFSPQSHTSHPSPARKSSPVAAPLPPHPAAAAAGGSRASETAFLRAPSPAFSFTSLGDLDGYQNQGFNGDVLPSVSELNLRDLLEVSVVTPLGVALPTLARVIDPRHGVDWGGWFKHLVDSPAMRTLVFEDGDSVLARPADTLGGAFDATEEEENRVDDDIAKPVLRPPARRVLLALPTLMAPDGDDETTRGSGGDGGSGGAAEDGGGEAGPWIGPSQAGVVTRVGHAASMLFCVVLHKVGGRFSVVHC